MLIEAVWWKERIKTVFMAMLTSDLSSTVTGLRARVKEHRVPCGGVYFEWKRPTPKKRSCVGICHRAWVSDVLS